MRVLYRRRCVAVSASHHDRVVLSARKTVNGEKAGTQSIVELVTSPLLSRLRRVSFLSHMKQILSYNCSTIIFFQKQRRRLQFDNVDLCPLNLKSVKVDELLGTHQSCRAPLRVYLMIIVNSPIVASIDQNITEFK